MTDDEHKRKIRIEAGQRAIGMLKGLIRCEDIAEHQVALAQEIIDLYHAHESDYMIELNARVLAAQQHQREVEATEASLRG